MIPTTNSCYTSLLLSFTLPSLHWSLPATSSPPLLSDRGTACRSEFQYSGVFSTIPTPHSIHSLQLHAKAAEFPSVAPWNSHPAACFPPLHITHRTSIAHSPRSHSDSDCFPSDRTCPRSSGCRTSSPSPINNLALHGYHVVRNRLAIAGVDHRGLVNPEHFAQQRCEAVEETLRHVSTRFLRDWRLLEVRVRVRDEHFELARADFLYEVPRIAGDVEHRA